MIYTSAIYATADNSMVTGTDAEGATETVPADYTVFRCPDDGPVGFVNNGGTIQPYVEPVPPAVTTTPTLFAMGQIKTEDGDISSVAISSALAGAFLFGVGEIWVFLTDEQPDTNYIVLAYDANHVRAYVNDDDKQTGFFIIRCTDFTDNPANPPSLNFEVKRVI